MAPKAKKGGGGGRTFRETPTEAHVAALELRAQVAEAAALELREAHLSAHNALVAEREALRGREGELEDVYSYVDTQMLHSARERHAYEKKIREAEEERAAAAETAEKEEEEARRAADATATVLREELAQKQAELDALVVFRERQPVLEGELAELRQLVAHQQATQREREHELNVRAWKQREALNEEMLSRIAQAKENFLDLTDSMLDKTAQRTIQRNAMVEEELDVQGGFLRRAIDDNDQLRAKGAALKRELGLLRQQGTAEVRRSVAHRQLAVAAAAQHDALATALDDARAEAEASAARERRARDELAKAHAQLDASRRQCAALASALRDARMRHAHAAGPEPPPTPPDWQQLSARSVPRTVAAAAAEDAAAAPAPPPPRPADGSSAPRRPPGRGARPEALESAGVVPQEWELPGRVRSAAPRESPRRGGGESAPPARPRMANTATGAAAGSSSLGGVLSIALGERQRQLHRATADDAPAAAERPATAAAASAGGGAASARVQTPSARGALGPGSGGGFNWSMQTARACPAALATSYHWPPRTAPALAAGTPLGSPRAVAGSAGVALRAPRAVAGAAADDDGDGDGDVGCFLTLSTMAMASRPESKRRD